MEPYGRSPYVRSNNPGFTTACTHNRGDPSGQPRAISIGTTRAYGCHSQSFNYQLFCTIRLLIRAHAGLSRGIPQLGNRQPGIKLGFFWKGGDEWGRENREFFATDTGISFLNQEFILEIGCRLR